jgi:hypothetical protein
VGAWVLVHPEALLMTRFWCSLTLVPRRLNAHAHPTLPRNRSGRHVTVEAVYYVLHGVVYQAPHLCTVLASRLVRAGQGPGPLSSCGPTPLPHLLRRTH